MTVRPVASPIHTWVIAYDIHKNKARRKVALCLASFGRRILYSVFECRLTVTEFERLRSEVQGLIDESIDRVRWYPLCWPCRKKLSRLRREDDDGVEAESGATIV